MERQRVEAPSRGRVGRGVRARNGLRPAVEGLEGRALLATTAPAPIGFVTNDLMLFGSPIAAPVGGTTGLIPLVTFKDLAANPSQYLAEIAWGDGKYSNGVVTIGAGVQQPGSPVAQLVGEISGAHNYAKAGTYQVAVAISRGAAENFTVTTATATGTAIPNSQVLAVAPISATTGTTTGSVTVAAFIDPYPGPAAPTSGVYATQIAWGDGTYSNGSARVVSGAGGPSAFNAVVNVLGAHTYFRPGTYGVVVALARGGAVYSSTVLVQVAGPAIAGAQVLGVAPLDATASRTTGNVTVAAFVDPFPGPAFPKAAVYQAQITWGDGTHSLGTASIVGGASQDGVSSVVVNVRSRHTYAAPGTYAVTVALARPGQALSSTTFARVS